MTDKRTSIPAHVVRALKLLTLAIGHILADYPDAANTVLRAAWPILSRSIAGKVQYFASAAFVAAVSGDSPYAIDALLWIQQELHRKQHVITRDTRDRTLDRCYKVMDQLPHTKQLKLCLQQIHYARACGDYRRAFELLAIADNQIKPIAHLVSPALRTAHHHAWRIVLEDMATFNGSKARLFQDLARHVNPTLVTV